MNSDLIAARAAVEPQDYERAHRRLQSYLQQAQDDGVGVPETGVCAFFTLRYHLRGF